MIPIREVDTLFTQVETAVKQLGFGLVDFSWRRQPGFIQAQVVITFSGNIGVEECARVSRVLGPRLEVLLETQDLRLEVSSPGLERTLKHQREFELFLGKPLKILPDGRDWVKGVLVEAGPDFLTFEEKGTAWTLERNRIVKAKLDLLGDWEHVD